MLDPHGLAGTAEALTGRVFRALDWFYVFTVTGFLMLCLWLVLGPHRHVRLGDPDDRPEFSTVSWLSMLFAAGMGTGLVFWGVAEPMTHFAAPHTGPGLTPEAARRAMVVTNFHWGLHAWAVYSVGALILAYFAFCRKTLYMAGAPIRAVFKGPWVRPVAWSADLIAVVAVGFGVAASICMGVLQLHSGLHVVLGISLESKAIAIGILVALMVMAMLSASTGLDRGIKWLSNINMLIAVLLMLFVLLAGPTGFLLRAFFNALGDYLSNVVSLSLRLYPYQYQDVGDWFQSWTLTLFVWWIAWAPFVGIFVARISRGRTVREFVIGVLLTPTVFSVLWFAVFGGTGIYEELHGAGGLAQLVQQDVGVALFTLFHRLPLSRLLDALSLALVFIFLVTSVDSATFVLGMITTEGDLNPPRGRKLAWGTGLGVLSTPLTLMGEVDVFKSVMVSGVLPYSLIMLLQVVALLRALRQRKGAS